jgi:hypothetical protein
MFYVTDRAQESEQSFGSSVWSGNMNVLLSLWKKKKGPRTHSKTFIWNVWEAIQEQEQAKMKQGFANIEAKLQINGFTVWK